MCLRGAAHLPRPAAPTVKWGLEATLEVLLPTCAQRGAPGSSTAQPQEEGGSEVMLRWQGRWRLTPCHRDRRATGESALAWFRDPHGRLSPSLHSSCSRCLGSSHAWGG